MSQLDRPGQITSSTTAVVSTPASREASNSSAQSMALNLLTLADQMQEKLTVRGDLQLGRVPIGRSSALRTSENLQALLGAGEARPERIMRRFVKGLI